MADPLVITALLTKRKEVLRAITVQESQVRRLKAQVATITETLRVFDPTYPSGSPRKHAKPVTEETPVGRKRLLPHGALGRTILEILRVTGQEMTAGEISSAVTQQYNIDVNAPRVLHELSQKVRRYLGLTNPGMVTRGLRGRIVTFQITDAGPSSF